MNATVVHDATKLARDLLEKGLQIMDFERSPGEIADEEAAFKEKQGKNRALPSRPPERFHLSCTIESCQPLLVKELTL